MINYLKLTEQDIEAQETVYRIANEQPLLLLLG